MESISFLMACFAVGLMGFAIQRGGTCMVAAVEDVLLAGRWGRLLAIVEAVVWVGVGLVLFKVAGLPVAIPPVYPVGPGTAVGGVLLGLGAFVNRACMFGTIARLGAGEWAYLATPAGFYLGSLFALPLAMPIKSGAPSILFAAPTWFGLLAAGLLGLLFLRRVQKPARTSGGIATNLWSPHLATSIIGIAFLIAMTTAGSWTYSDLLASLAHGMADALPSQLILLMLLLAGAILGGWTAGITRLAAPDGVQTKRCLLGGGLMGLGGAMTPGGNDGLVLLGMPLFWSYAWLAVASMCATIFIALRLRRRT